MEPNERQIGASLAMGDRGCIVQMEPDDGTTLAVMLVALTHVGYSRVLNDSQAAGQGVHVSTTNDGVAAQLQIEYDKSAECLDITLGRIYRGQAGLGLLFGAGRLRHSQKAR